MWPDGEESALSLFHISAVGEWNADAQQALFLARELKNKRLSSHFIVRADSPIYHHLNDEGFPVVPLTQINKRALSTSLRLAGMMKRRRASLVHFHDAVSFSIAAPAASLARVPVRVLSHRADLPVPAARISLKDIDAVIALSEGVKSVLVRGGVSEDLVDVVPSGIDFSPYRGPQSITYLRQELSFSPDEFLVGVVAPLEDVKGLASVLETAEIVKLNAPQVRIVVLGEGSVRMEFDKIPKSASSDDVIFFLGFKEDFPRIMASLDVFVMASPMDGLGVFVMKAMAGRRPVVATRVGRIPELIVHRETGLLVPPRSPKSLADAILKLFMDRKLAAQLAGRGAEAVQEKFSAEAMARKILAVYDKAAARKGVRLA